MLRGLFEVMYSPPLGRCEVKRLLSHSLQESLKDVCSRLSLSRRNYERHTSTRHEPLGTKSLAFASGISV